jgi:aspartate carbamoyltransferase catalytic subunit
MKCYGGDVVSVTAERRSIQKGETLQDTNRTLACYGDAVLLPHPDVGSSLLCCEVLAKVIEETGVFYIMYAQRRIKKEGMKTSKGHTVYLGGDAALSRAK